MRAFTVHGVLKFFHTHVVTYCANETVWTLRLTMTAEELKQTGDVVTGRQGPNLTTSDEREPVMVATRVRGHMGDHPQGTIISDINRRPGADNLRCTSDDVTYTLRR